MDFPESIYDRFITLAKEKGIVCFGAGKILERCVKFINEHGFMGNLIAIVDNDKKKQGLTKEVYGVRYEIKSLEELADINGRMDFFILITSSYYQEMEEQIKVHPLLCDKEILDARVVMEGRTHHLACYTDIFQDMGVGIYGEKLTISILMHNRASLTVRLIESMDKELAGYKGKVIIGNNFSDRNEMKLVNEKLAQVSLNFQIFDFEKHYPIPQGKNILNQKADTEWILQLDNDMYFTDNPISKINEDIACLGCSVWGLPYYDTRAKRVANFGSNLKFMDGSDKSKRLECLYDLAFEQKKRMWKPMLCTYAAGCAFLFRKDIFISQKGYDENLFMMEDIDLMYRLNREGYKIGNIGMKCLVHDHKEIDSELGKEYEKVRFDEKRLYSSKEYLKAKYGFEF